MKYLKTYGKQKTKLSAWLSIQDRKQVFDSTASSEADASAKQTSKPSRTSKRNNRVKKKKPRSVLTSEDEESVFTHPMSPAKSTARSKPRRADGRPVRVRKRTKVSLSLSSDEENIVPPKNLRGTSRSNVREKDSSSTEKTRSVLECSTMQKDSLVRLPSAGRFVTRRRCAIASSSQLNSSDEFVPLSSTTQTNHPPRRRCIAKRRCSWVLLESSTDNSVNPAVPHQEISLNESVEHSLGPCSRKPIFCSTPSAAPLSKKSKLRGFNPISSPPSISVSCIGAVSVGSPEQLTSLQNAAPYETSVGKQAIIGDKPSQFYHEETSDCVVVAHSRGTHDKSQKSAQSQSRAGKSPGLPSMITIGSDLSSYFISTSGERDWLTDFLKEKCLTQICTVRLERIEDLIQLFSETTYSSCLGSVSNSSGNKHSLFEATSHNSDHVSASKLCCSLKLAATCDNLTSVKSAESSVPDAVFVSDSQSTEASVSDDCVQSEHRSTIDLFSTYRNSFTDEVDMQVQDIIELSITQNKCLSRESSSEQQLTPKLGENESLSEAAELTKELKEKCLSGKPVIKMNKMSITEIKQKSQDNMGSDRSTSDQVSEETESDVTAAGPKACRKKTSDCSSGMSALDRDKKTNNKQRKKMSLALKEKSCRTSTHRPGTTRKACISGLSVTRWKSRDAFTTSIGQREGTTTIDCSINELISSQRSKPGMLSDINMGFSTPIKGHNFSSLLAELTPRTHTWSRLKAALSTHRKVNLTPKTPGPGRSSKMDVADLSQDLFATPFRTPLSKRLLSQLITHDPQLVLDNDEMSDAEKVFAECNQPGPLAWDKCLLPQRMKQCVKIGEGTFGEVFSTKSGKPDGEIVALKVIPVEGSEKVNGEEQKTFGEILHEIIISKELSCLKEKEKNQTSGFIGLRDLHCVKGGYPPEFLAAWDKFDKRKGSENDRPDFFGNEQLFIILEFEFGGTDLEHSNGTLPSLIVAKSILHQVTAALAVAEQELQFEHRDLHWGNVLVKVTKQRTIEFSLNGALHALETKGVLVRIIDYSLSRLEIDELTVSCDISNDDELFMGQGDYQFDIYRLMRLENGNEWCSYNPHSNVLWLHYLCSKLLAMKYRSLGGKRNMDIRGELTSFYDNVLQFSSATEVLQHSPLFQ